MKIAKPDRLFAVKNQLAEGPLWHPTRQCLYWVDIEAGDLYQSGPGLTHVNKTHFNTSVGAFAFAELGEMILATGHGFLKWKDGLAEPIQLWNPLPARPNVRLNDGKVDPIGRFWAGSIDTDQVKGKLYCLAPDGEGDTILDGIGISNGLDWSPDRKTMYYTDSYRYTIYTFDYDLGSGSISNQRPFIQLPKTTAEIVPDGLCVDAEGCLWSAHWNGWQVVRYSPQGQPILSVKVPAQRVTSCCFGGEKGNLLFITTARIDLSPEDLDSQPNAGDIFVFETDTTGQATHFFGNQMS